MSATIRGFTFYMNRIFISLSTEQLKSLDRGRYYLSYLQIRSQVNKQCGGFYFNQFCDVVKLQPRAAKLHIQALISKGFIIDQGNDHYRITKQNTLAGNGRRFLVYNIATEILLSFHSSKIADFRAFLSELEYERYKKHQKALIKGYSIKDDFGQVIRQRNPTLRAWDKKLALSCGTGLTGLKTATVSKYRKRQKLVSYKWELKVFKQKKSFKQSSGNSNSILDFEGFTILCSNGSLIQSPISKRVSSIILKRVSCS